METHNATITRGEKPALVFSINDENLEICLSEDNPNKIKAVFNELIQKLKHEKFKFTLDDSIDDLFSNICKEYIKQLNSELAIVHSQLKTYDLLES